MITLDTILADNNSIELGATTLAALETINIGNAGGGAAVNIQDGGNSITVDGEVELGATTLAALESITVQNGAGGAAVNIQDGGNSITIDGEVELGATSLAALESISVEATEAGYATWKVTAETVDTTAGGVQLVSTALAGRIRVEVQNLGTQDIYIKNATGVTTANGLKVPKGSSFEQKLDAGAALWAIAPSGSSDVRVAEYAS